MNNRQDVKTIFSAYAALLFLRQWYNDEHYVNHLSYPQIPSGQTEKRRWQESLNYFKELVESHLGNVELVRALGMDFSAKRLIETNQPNPLDYIDEIKKKIEEDFKAAIELSELDKEKIAGIDKITLDVVKEVYDSVIRIKGEPVNEADRDDSSNVYQAIRGEDILLDRESLIKDPSISYIGFDSILGQQIRYLYLQHIYLKFSINVTKTYEVPHRKIFEGIDKLKLNHDYHVIVAFNVNLSFYKDYKDVPLIDGTSGVDFFYKSVPIYTFEVSSMPSPSLFVLRKSDLPMAKHIDWSEVNDMSEETKAYWKSMDCIDKELKIYRKVIDLNKEVDEKNLRVEQQGYTEEYLKNKVWIRVDFIGHFWFKKGVKIISISENKMFQEGGIQNSLDDIPSFD